ncbi:hypothetical protein MM300_11645 [Evansella sp. LMS18]|uniref:DUF6612 family protein n=1 Tax=Evansella sp. LMS18 TaxID=2924033 RepID=UPI0020D153B4|nr:DUF6612 family protein [Evansella sp. LMS18]UTR08615.1 hypothetical protein MM300_11645 [Evansella sp. LMS18]
MGKITLFPLTAVILAFVLLTGITGTVSANEDTPTAEELLQNSYEAMEDLNSFSTRIAMEQLFLTAGQEEPIHTKSLIEQDVVANPFNMYQKTENAAAPDAGIEEDTVTEAYWTEDAIYQQDPDGSWIKISNEITGAPSVNFVENPADEARHMAGLSDKMSVYEEDGYYILVFDGSGEEFLNNTQEALAAMEDEVYGDIMAGTMEGMTIDTLDYQMIIDKESHFLSYVTMEMEITMETEAGSEQSKQRTSTEYINFNGLDSISLPDQVEEEAVDLDELIKEETDGAGEAAAGTAPDNDDEGVSNNIGEAAAAGENKKDVNEEVKDAQAADANAENVDNEAEVSEAGSGSKETASASVSSEKGEEAETETASGSDASATNALYPVGLLAGILFAGIGGAILVARKKRAG